MTKLSHLWLLDNLALYICLIFPESTAVSNGCSDVCEYNEWGKDAKCQGQDLTYVPQECKLAKTLRMQDNRLEHLPTGSFSNFTRLKYLYLDRNNLTLECGAFEGCTKLEQIHLNEVHLPTLKPEMMMGLSSVKYMFLNKAGVKVIKPETFKNMSQLQYLWLQDNELTEFPCNAFSTTNSMKYLYLDSNKISQLPDYCLRSFSQLTHLYIKNNPLGDVNGRAFIGLSSLVFLDMQYTNLTRVPTGIFPHANNIETLHLSFNQIQYLHNRDFTSLSKLQNLYIQHNRIIAIQRKSFEYLNSLNVLDLSFNKIKSIEDGALNNFPNLIDLQLQNNLLNSTKNISFSDIPELALLRLSDNPIHCDCSVYPFHYWLRGATGMPSDADPSYLAYCSTPKKFQGQLVTGLSHHDICPPTNEDMPEENHIMTPAPPLYQRDRTTHEEVAIQEGIPQPAGGLDTKLIGIITGVTVLIIFIIGGIIILGMKFHYNHQRYRHDQELPATYEIKKRSPVNVTDNPMEGLPELPPRPEDLRKIAQIHRHPSGSSQLPLMSRHHIVDNREQEEDADAVGFIYQTSLSRPSRPSLSPQSSLSTSHPQDDGDYSEVFTDDQVMEEDKEEPTAADWVKKNVVLPESGTTPTGVKSDSGYVQWKDVKT